jgi:adenylate cyclase class IV
VRKGRIKYYFKNKNAVINDVGKLCDMNEQLEQELERYKNIISKIETLVINHNCDTGDIYYKYNGKYLKSELKERILELLELKGE